MNISQTRQTLVVLAGVITTHQRDVLFESTRSRDYENELETLVNLLDEAVASIKRLEKL